MNVTDFATSNFLAAEVYADERNRLTPLLTAELVKVVTSPVAPEAAAYFAEFVYANAASFLQASRDRAADVADFVTANGFYGFRDAGRGGNIAKILRGQSAVDVPNPLSQFVFEEPATSQVPLAS